jgi:hypothetical protein
MLNYNTGPRIFSELVCPDSRNRITVHTNDYERLGAQQAGLKRRR